MDVLYELVELLPASYQVPFTLKLKELYQLLREKRYTEEELREVFCPQSKHYFNKLKSQLKKALLNCIIANPPVWADSPQKELMDTCLKEFAIYKVLIANSSRVAGIQLATQLLAKAQRLEQFDLVWIISSDLEYHYSVSEIKTVKAKRYAQISDKYLELMNAEKLIRRYYGKVMQICSLKSKRSTKDMNLLQEANINTLPLLALKSSKLDRVIYNIIIGKYYAEHDYPRVIEYSNKALQSFPKDHPNIVALRFAFTSKKITAFTALQQYDEAKAIAKEAGQLVPVGKFNWHLILIQRIIICFHSGAYEEAYELYKAQAKYQCPYTLLAEYWKVIQGYLYFLIHAGLIEPYSEERFNLGKFLNEIPIFSQDKAGININVILIQILILMQRGHFGRIIDKIEAIQAYARKHTRQPETARAYCFIQMIVKMEAASFHRASTERKTQKYWQQLEATPLRLGQSLAVEMVPYAALWELILDMLDHKFRAIRGKKRTTIR